MANGEHLAILKQGVEVWNRWRLEHQEVLPDLSGAALRRYDLFEMSPSGAILRRAAQSGVPLLGADLSKINLSGTNLGTADLSEAILSGANLSAAHLRAANLSKVNLQAANLTLSNLVGTNLSGALLGEADLNSAEMWQTALNDLDLCQTKGLETVRHYGPSDIGIQTIYKSKGKISEVFLRGAGVPDSFIEYMRSLVISLLDYFSAFISYSSKDQVFADNALNE